MRHRIRLGETESQVDASTRDGDLVLSVEGPERREFPCRRLPDGRLLLDCDGGTVEAVAVRDGGDIWVSIEGRSWLLEDADKAPARRARSGREKLGDVTPPMPAVVVRVQVAPGDLVTKGQGLIVVSAMKMETTLVSPHDGEVASVNAVVGEKVAPGDVLVDVTPAAAEQEETGHDG